MRARVRELLIAVVLLMYSQTVLGQAGAPARRITAGTSLPSTCVSSVVIRDIFYKSGSSAGIYVCTAANTWTLQNGAADVVGPASSTDNAIVRYDGITGKLLQDSLVTIGDLGALALPAAAQITWGGVADGLVYVSGTGPRFEDATSGVLWTLNLQSLGGNRTVTVPDGNGTMALTTSNVATATALAANPTDCAAGQFATTIAASGNLTCAVPLAVGNCTLDGGATATCTATVPSGCTPVCSYNSASTPRTVSCAVSGTTLTAVSAVTLDAGVVNYHCY